MTVSSLFLAANILFDDLRLRLLSLLFHEVYELLRLTFDYFSFWSLNSSAEVLDGGG